MANLDDIIEILTDNGYAVSISKEQNTVNKEVLTAYEMSARHRAVSSRYTVREITLERTALKLLEYVKRNAPLTARS
jgi:hypothetical protein